MKKIYSLIVLFLLSSCTILFAQPDFTSPNGTSNNVYPFNSTVNRVQWIYHPADITPTLTPGYITDLYVMVHPTLGNSATANFTNLIINMGTTTNMNTVNGPWLTGMTNVLTAPTLSVVATKGQWAKFTLQTPFFWDGTSNLLMEISQTNYNPGFYIVNNDQTGSRRAWGTVGSTNTTGAGSGLMYMGFDMLNEDDMGVIGIAKPEDLNDLCAGLNKFTVTVKNFGANDILSGNVTYSIDNVIKGTASLPGGTLSPLSTIDVELPGFVQTSYNVPFLFKAWTHNPNNVQDPLAINDTFELTITPTKLGVVLNDMVDTYICKGGAITLDAGTNINTDYTWSNGTQAQHNTINTIGTHWVWGYNTEGCQSFDTFEVSYAPLPMAAQNISVIDLNNGVLLFDIGAVQNINYYEWDFGDASPIELGAGPKPHAYAQAGSYTVILKLGNDCDTITRSFNLIWSGKTSVHDFNKQDALSLYPNPVADMLMINVENTALKLDAYQIINNLGQVLQKDNIKNNSKIDVSKLAAGNYIIKLQTNIGEIMKPISIIK